MYQTLMQVGGAAPQAPWWQTPALMVGVFAIIYFFMIRPQQKKQKELQKHSHQRGCKNQLLDILPSLLLQLHRCKHILILR